jgi:hypothetical protein
LRRELPLKSGYCRLCWCQARDDRAATAADARSAVVLAPYLAQVRHHQLFFAGMDNRRAAPRALPCRHGEKGRPLKPPPPATTRQGSGSTQLALFAALPARDYSRVRFDLRRGGAPGNPWLAWALHLAYVTAEARGWQPVTRRAMQRVLVTLLAGHCDGEVISASAVHAVAGRHSASTHCALEIMAAMGILADDRPGLFSGWLDAKLSGLAEGLGSEARRWAVTLHDGGAPGHAPRHRAGLPARRAAAAGLVGAL